MKENKQISDKFNTRKQGNVNILFCDDNPVECIYKQAVVLPHPQISGQAIIKQPVCSDNCPMFDLTPGLFGKLKFHCTGREIDVYQQTSFEQ